MKINHKTLALRHATAIIDNRNHQNGSRATSKRAAVSVDLKENSAITEGNTSSTKPEMSNPGATTSQSYGMTAGTARRVKEGGENGSRKGRARRGVAKTTGRSSQRRAFPTSKSNKKPCVNPDNRCYMKHAQLFNNELRHHRRNDSPYKGTRESRCALQGATTHQFRGYSDECDKKGGDQSEQGQSV